MLGSGCLVMLHSKGSTSRLRGEQTWPDNKPVKKLSEREAGTEAAQPQIMSRTPQIP